MASMRSLGAAVLVTAIIGMRVSKHYWQAYDPFDKFFAVFVLLALVTFPIWGETKSGKKTELFEVYVLILMVVR